MREQLLQPRVLPEASQRPPALRLVPRQNRVATPTTPVPGRVVSYERADTAGETEREKQGGVMRETSGKQELRGKASYSRACRSIQSWQKTTETVFVPIEPFSRVVTSCANKEHRTALVVFDTPTSETRNPSLPPHRRRYVVSSSLRRARTAELPPPAAPPACFPRPLLPPLPLPKHNARRGTRNRQAEDSHNQAESADT